MFWAQFFCGINTPQWKLQLTASAVCTTCSWQHQLFNCTWCSWQHQLFAPGAAESISCLHLVQLRASAVCTWCNWQHQLLPPVAAHRIGCLHRFNWQHLLFAPRAADKISCLYRMQLTASAVCNRFCWQHQLIARGAADIISFCTKCSWQHQLFTPGLLATCAVCTLQPSAVYIRCSNQLFRCQSIASISHCQTSGSTIK